MSPSACETTMANLSTNEHPASATVSGDDLAARLGAYFEALENVRRGVCLLNAGRSEEAEASFSAAARMAPGIRSLPAYLAACLTHRGEAQAAAEQFRSSVDTNPKDAATRIRYALSLWQAGSTDEAIESLRDGIRHDPESAELHFQLGTLLASLERYDEAELRFTQAVSIDRAHADALASLAMCFGVRNAPRQAVTYLLQAQARRPHDGRIGMLLSQAARAARQTGHMVRVHAEMPDVELDSDSTGIDELSRVIEAEPDFVDAFLSIPAGKVDESVFAMLLRTLEVVLERQPEQAELHYHCGRVLDRLGRREDAISQNERAVQLNPKFTRALVELGKLYSETARKTDARQRLEQAVEAGADLADVHFLLGNLHLDRGQIHQARTAYKRALSINEHYEAAQLALTSLSAKT